VRPSAPGDCLAEAPGGPWLFDPIVIDSAPQIAILWARAQRDMTPLPAGIGRCRRYGGPPDGPLTCHFEVLPGTDAQTVLANVFFAGRDGRLRVSVEGLECTGSKDLNRLAGSAAPAAGAGR